MTITISCVVEGDGEVEAVPILIRRIAELVKPDSLVRIPRPIRLPKTKLRKKDELTRAVRLAKLNVPAQGGIFVLMDADKDCPAILGPHLREQVLSVSGETPVGIVIAKAEFETWLIAAAESIAGKRGLSADMTAPEDPESILAAKGWLDRHMPRNRCYRETLDQPALTAVFNLTAAQRSPSFEKCYREVVKLLG
jgi:hypothetical protein